MDAIAKRTQTHRTGIALALALASALAGCGKGGPETAGGAEAEKKAQEAAAAELEQPVALISAYRPHLKLADGKDKYAPQRRPELDKATLAAANEIRHAANGVKQKLEKTGAAVTKDVELALRNVTGACAEASEPEKLVKCEEAVAALDAALEKGKFPRVADASITPEARTAIAPFLRAKGPGTAEAEYIAKRADPAAATGDVIAACQAASGEVDGIARQYEKAEEPLRLIAVTHKMSLESQCNKLTATETLRADVVNCKKKAKSTECKITCAKAKTIIDDTVPAAAFGSLEKDYAEICKE